MERISSQWTIVLRIVLPTIWFTTIVSLLVLLTWAVQGRAHMIGNLYFQAAVVLILGSGLAFIRLLLLRLYRVDMDDRFVYISNYFKTYKYPFSDIDHIRNSKLLSGHVYCIVLKSKGSFGKNIYFLAARLLWNDFLKNHPGLFEIRE